MGKIVGIDPGSEGGACAVEVNEHGVTLIDAIGFDAAKSSEILRFLRDFKGCNVYLEKVGSTPGDGVKSLFSFGRNVGRIETLIEIAGNPMFEVTPVLWSLYYRGRFGHASSDNKARNIMFARHLLGPELERLHKSELVSPRCTSYHTGAVDAFLIAHFAAFNHHKIVGAIEGKQKRAKSKAPKPMFI